MTEVVKLTKLKTILGVSDQDSLLSEYLSFAKTEIINWRYGSTKNSDIVTIEDSEDNYAIVSPCSFVSSVSPTSGSSYVFTYSEDNESWQYDSENVTLSDYGIDYDEDLIPIDGETLTVKYSEIGLAQFDWIQIWACVAGFNLRGAENQTAHSENGIGRSFRYSDTVDYIHNHVPAFVGVV